MTAAWCHQRRRRSSLVVHVHSWVGRQRGCPRAAVGQSAAGRFLEGSLAGLTLQQHSHTTSLYGNGPACCVARGVARGKLGGPWPTYSSVGAVCTATNWRTHARGRTTPYVAAVRSVKGALDCRQSRRVVSDVGIGYRPCHFLDIWHLVVPKISASVWH